MGRLLLLWRPPGGQQDDDITITMLVARVPIYASNDSRRGFSKKCRIKENAVVRALNFEHVDCDVKVVMAPPVDDVVRASKAGHEHMGDRFLAKYQLRKIERGPIRFCGREIEQSVGQNSPRSEHRGEA